jgi:hypothetical protein
MYENFVHQVGHWLRLHYDARSAKYKKNSGLLFPLCYDLCFFKLLSVVTEGRFPCIMDDLRVGVFLIILLT